MKEWTNLMDDKLSELILALELHSVYHKQAMGLITYNKCQITQQLIQVYNTKHNKCNNVYLYDGINCNAPLMKNGKTSMLNNYITSLQQ